MDHITRTLCNNYTNLSLLGFTDVEVNGSTITFTFQDGNTASMTLPTPADGKSITDVNINSDGALICMLSDGTTINAGTVPTIKGDPGDPGEKGEPGDAGKSAYDIWLEQGNVGSEQDFLESLKGEEGTDGKSAYQTWLDAGNTGTEQDFLDSLKGEKGADGTMVFEDLTDEQKESLKGADGFNPIVTVTEIEGGHNIAIEDVNGVQEFEVLDGKDAEGKVYTSLAELGLDTTATINDIIGAMEDGSQITYKTDVFDYATEYNNIQYGTVTIHKQSDSRVQVFMTDKDTGNLYVGRMDSSNKVIGWRKDSFHRIVTQGTAGYFKFKPTLTGIDQPLRVTVTDNYGGMINISGATPSGTQYKPFKCIRLSNGAYSYYDAIKTTNNKMEKLYFYDGYFYLKVVSYTTCTFTGLIEAPTYVETFDNTDAEEITIRSVFDTPYNNGYADPSTVVIGDTDTSDGVIKTLGTLGFIEDVMTWDNGEYRVSHVGGLTNLPAEITEEKPGFRLEHHDVKKWGSNHNPHRSTYGCRQSILHYKGNIFVRYQESGATAGVLITDTGWQNIAILGKDLELYPQTKVVTSLNKGTWQVGQRIKQKTDFTASTADVNFEFVAKNEGSSTNKQQKMTIYQLTPIENGTNASLSLIVYEDGRAQVTVWPATKDMPRNDYNVVCEGYLKEYVNEKTGGTLGGKEVKMLEINLSDDAYQPESTAGVITMPIPNLPTTAKVIRAEGYYEDVDGDYFIVSANANGGVGTIKFASSKWCIAVNPSLGGKNKGFAKIYYTE